ncbi:MAG: Spy/CpxP family protein refolding chaperone [Polyangiales bacterium]
MRSAHHWLLGTLLLTASPALAQMGPPAGHGPAGGDAHGPMKPGGEMGPGHGMGHGDMGHGHMGMHEDDDCDGESCPYMHGDDDDGHGMHMRRLEQIAGELGLSDAVRKNVKDAIYDATKQGIALGADLAQARLELGRLLDQDKPDSDAVLKQVDKVGQLRTELVKVRIRTMLKIMGMLTPEQRKKLKQHPHGGFR